MYDLTAELLAPWLPGSRVLSSAPNFTEPEKICSVSRTTMPDGSRLDIFVDRSPDKALRLAGDTQMTRGSCASRANTCLEGFPCNKKQTPGPTKQIICCLSVSCEQDALARDPSALFDLDPCWRHWAAALVKGIYQTQHCRGSWGERERPGSYANKHQEEMLSSAVKGLTCMFLFTSGRNYKLKN